MKRQNIKIAKLIFYLAIIGLVLFSLSLSFWYTLLHYKLNWINFAFYTFSWWSVQTSLILLLFALGGVINIFWPKYLQFINNDNFKLFLVFISVVTSIFFTIGIFVSLATNTKFTPNNDGQAIYWISTAIGHWILPIAIIVYFFVTSEVKEINLKRFYLKDLHKFYYFPIVYTIYIGVREVVLLVLPVDEKLFNYASGVGNYYAPYFFQDFRQTAYYILYLIVLVILIFLILTILILINNIRYYRRKNQLLKEE
ncbi:hypothetical protein [Spiroplasma eriocheiris]|uniref:ABC transporter permease n=1 Tax=Spiroplasma eriocheiris TaxID=315358 RepID=A0A0H3XJ54_9MOLU|nr:hypothetical protein [Spiroplasma eriocheiris]AHF57385.1 putative transmembrane protein [Spiroplasma eriocheiris CCTCC M 207170]AKM53841.1 hypothetical protein SERIO_v1c02570 [Spiroplasma eriocheiris]